MKIELKAERLNPHMKRKELHIAVEHEGEATPRRDALQQLVAKQLGHNAENTDVRGIHTEGGIGRSAAKVFVWSEKKVAAGKKEESQEKNAEKREEKQN